MGRIIYPLITCDNRSDDTYHQVQESNQIFPSPLLEICQLRSDFPPDPMHFMYLGIVRKLLFYYCRPTKGLFLTCRFAKSVLLELSSKISFLRAFFPKEFQRKPRPFSELEHFKATEFRSFLLYLGPYLFKNALPKKFYDQFIMLHFAMYVYSSQRFKHLYNCASVCCTNAAILFEELFGKQSLVYNVHLLNHIHEYASAFETVNEFAAFDFESFLGLIKKRIRPTREIFVSTINQAKRACNSYQSFNSVLHFSVSTPDNFCLLTDNRVGLITSIDGDEIQFVSGFFLKFIKPLYSYPYCSSLLNIGYYKVTQHEFTLLTPITKCIGFKKKESSEVVIVPFC